MARDVARQKGLYYPTPASVVALLATLVEPSPHGGMLLDNYAGEGAIGAQLAQAWNLRPYFVELEAERAAKCAQLGQTLHGPAEMVRLFQYSAHEKQPPCPAVWILNPPYDTGDKQHNRQETRAFKRTVAYASVPGTLGVFILPQSLLNDTTFASHLYVHFDIQYRRCFPDPEYKQFGQVVLLGYKRAKPEPWPTNDWLTQHIRYGYTELFAGEFLLQLRNFGQPKRFEMKIPDWEALEAAAYERGADTTKYIQDILKPRLRAGYFKPATEMGDGHAILVGAASLADSLQVGNLAIKGSTRQYLETHKFSERNEKGERIDVEQSIERQAHVYHIIDLTTFKHTKVDSAETPAEYETFLRDYALPLIAQIRQKYPPLYNGDSSRWDRFFDRMHSPIKLPDMDIDGLLPAQRQTAAAILKIFDKNNVAILDGKMGVGKTFIAGAVFTTLNAWKLAQGKPVRIVVTCPAHLVKKWSREPETCFREWGAQAVIIGQERTWPDTGKKKVSRPLADIEYAMHRPGLTFLIISKEIAKLGSAWQPRVHQRKRHRLVKERLDNNKTVLVPYTWTEQVCPTCFKLQENEDGNPVQYYPDNKKHVCMHCGGAYFTMGEADGKLGRRKTTCIPDKRAIAVGFRRHPIADYLSKRYRGEYYLVLDEAHQFKGGDSDQAYAAHDLIVGACKTIFMTGTLYGGKASTLFHILYRTLPFFRTMFDHREVDRFIDCFGLRKITKKRDESSSSSFGGYKRWSDWNVQRTEIPGVHPAMITFLLPYTVFLTLDDLKVKLPPYNEYLLPARLETPDLEAVMGPLRDMRTKAFVPDAQGWSTWMQAALGWPDRPIAEAFTFRNGETASLPNVHWVNGDPKERVLTKYLRSEISRGRNVMLCFEQVNKRDPLPHYERVLKAAGLRPFIMRQTVKSADREDYMLKHIAQGHNVMLLNGGLVETGLDLLYFPTIIHGQLGWSPYKTMQINKRPHRLGQDREVKIVYCPFTTPDKWEERESVIEIGEVKTPMKVRTNVRERTLQELTVALMVKKLRYSAVLDGRLAEGLAAADEDGDSFLAELQRLVLTGKTIETLDHVIREEDIMIDLGGAYHDELRDQDCQLSWSDQHNGFLVMYDEHTIAVYLTIPYYLMPEGKTSTLDWSHSNLADHRPAYAIGALVLANNTLGTVVGIVSTEKVVGESREMHHAYTVEFSAEHDELFDQSQLSFPAGNLPPAREDMTDAEAEALVEAFAQVTDQTPAPAKKKRKAKQAEATVGVDEQVLREIIDTEISHAQVYVKKANLATLQAALTKVFPAGRTTLVHVEIVKRIKRLEKQAEATVPAAAPSPLPGPKRYLLRSRGLGMLTLSNGHGTPIDLTWLGGQELSGDQEAVALVRAHFTTHLDTKKPTKPWLVEVEVK